VTGAGVDEQYRYDETGQRIAKTSNGVTTVYVYGTLEGVWLDGSPFAGIRFVDRFEIDEAGLIVDQKVWNDLAEARRAAGA
jgi:YD repeat-containing protein